MENSKWTWKGNANENFIYMRFDGNARGLGKENK